MAQYVGGEGMSQRIMWRTGLMIPGMGGTVFAAEENGRRFWSVTTRDKGGWPFTHEFCTAEEGLRLLKDRYDGASQ